MRAMLDPASLSGQRSGMAVSVPSLNHPPERHWNIHRSLQPTDKQFCQAGEINLRVKCCNLD
jgi:hypothetical protein